MNLRSDEKELIWIIRLLSLGHPLSKRGGTKSDYERALGLPLKHKEFRSLFSKMALRGEMKYTGIGSGGGDLFILDQKKIWSRILDNFSGKVIYEKVMFEEMWPLKRKFQPPRN